ncbi:hypothetical protein T265_06141 [Opisthorchis viverrini]|uniref:Uncharacterized protein n=1 Tax=Opisthorchis viverrini TaxID=6198 RepID=A0A074ZH78_OPIVI|nr:hypothetical protein T265_06141 [Opisthorchis viverrini]KER26636.1 hypothetical protein T265_06141 [Opisthorchis viverrini]
MAYVDLHHILKDHAPRKYILVGRKLTLQAGTGFALLVAILPEESTRAGTLSGSPSLDRESREAEVGSEPRTFRTNAAAVVANPACAASGFNNSDDIRVSCTLEMSGLKVVEHLDVYELDLKIFQQQKSEQLTLQFSAADQHCGYLPLKQDISSPILQSRKPPRGYILSDFASDDFSYRMAWCLLSGAPKSCGADAKTIQCYFSDNLQALLDKCTVDSSDYTQFPDI